VRSKAYISSLSDSWDEAIMSRSTAPVWVCDLPDCRHVWLAASDVPPSHCAKCRSRGWNALGGDLNNRPIQRVPESVPQAPVPFVTREAPDLKTYQTATGKKMCPRHREVEWAACRAPACKQDYAAYLDRKERG
jgi:hypothetical protein